MSKELVSKVARTTEGLRQALFDEMDALRNGKSNSQQSRSVAALASQVISSVRLEIDYQKFQKSNNKPKEVQSDSSFALTGK